MWLPLRKQAEIRNQWLKARLETILPEIMRREGVSMWLVEAREYNEDPVILSLIPDPAMGARRRTLLVFTFDAAGEFHCLSLDRYGYPGFYEQRWTPANETQQACLRRVVAEFNPATIGINTSSLTAFADGMSHGEYSWLMDALGEYADRVCSAERVAVGWLERRSEAELGAYPKLVEMGHNLIRELYSRDVIQPGLTTTDDAVWWLRERMASMGVRAWFHPTVEIQYPGRELSPAPGFDRKAPRKLIQPGDLLHVDVGFYALGLATDQQQHAYVLKRGETEAPAGMVAALREGNRLQDIVIDAMQVGRTGNEVLKRAREQAINEGITPSVYSHPLGNHGHAAGPTIGLWDNQEHVPGMGEYTLFDDTCYSIELNIQRPLPEWGGQVIRIALEEDAVLTGGKLSWLSGRQTEFHLI